MKRAFGWVVILAGFLAGLFALPRLPEVVTPDFSGRSMGPMGVAFALPTTALVIWLLARAGSVPWLERRLGRWLPSWMMGDRSGLEPPVAQREAMETVALAAVIVFIAMHAAGLSTALRGPVSIDRIVPALVGVALIVGGNSAPRLRRNLIAGIRTRATLEDPVVWARVHRVFGRWLVGSGVLTFATALVAGRHGLTVAAFAVIGSVVVSCLVEHRRQPGPLSSRFTR